MSTAKKSKTPAKKKSPAPKAAKKAPAAKAAAKKTAAPAKKKAAPKLKPKPKATHPQKKDVGIFGAIQKNIQEGIAVITETILPTPKKKARKS